MYHKIQINKISSFFDFKERTDLLIWIWHCNVKNVDVTLELASQVSLLNRSVPFLEEIRVSAEGVTELLKGLNPSKALGPEELYPSVLKELASQLGPMFAHLFQQSIDTGGNPKGMFEKEDRSLVCNYRPSFSNLRTMQIT